MLSVSDARIRILSILHTVETTSLPIDRLAGRVLAGDVSALTDLPLFDNSSVDGFALRTTDITVEPEIPPRALSVVADIRAGSPSVVHLKTGECARIMTGAPLPPGADAVVMVEDTDFKVRSPGTPAPRMVMVHKSLRRGKMSATVQMTCIRVIKSFPPGSVCAPRKLACLPCSVSQKYRFSGFRRWHYYPAATNYFLWMPH